MIKKTIDYKDILKEAPKFFDAYQAGYTLEKRSGALNMAYISGICTRKLRSGNAAGNPSDTGYAPIYEKAASRGIINYGVNIMIDPFRNQLTAMIQNIPGYEVYPTNEDDDKKAVAEKSTELLKYHDEKIFNIKSKIGELYAWGTGPVATAYLEHYPEDTDISFPVAGTENDGNIVNGGVAVDEFGKPVDVPITERKQKRLQVAVKTIWDVATSEDSPDCLADNCTIQITCAPITLRKLKTWAKQEAVDKIEKGLQPRTSVIEDPKTNEVRMAKGLSARNVSSILTGDDRQIKVYYVYHKPDDEFPDGWFGITDDKGTELFWKNSLPIPGIMPLTQLNTNNLDAGEFLKKSVFDDARGPQVLYQGLFDSRAANSMLAARPPRQRVKGVVLKSDNKVQNDIYPKQGQDDEVEFQEPWKSAVMANPGLANVLMPRFLEVPGLNSDVATMLQECKENMLNVTGQNLANVGSFPNADLSGKSVENQVSVDQMGQLPLLTLCNDFWYRFRVKTLKAIAKYYTTEQIAYMLNDNTINEAGKFKLEDIDDSYDIRLITTEGLPTTPMGKIDFFFKLMASAPSPEEQMDAWNRIRSTLSESGLVDSTQDLEEQLAELENQMILGDESLISDMNKMVPAIDSLGQPKVDQMGQPMMEPLAKQRVRKWANRFQTEPIHLKVLRPLIVGPDIMRNGEAKTQLAAWHAEAHEEYYAIKTQPPEPTMVPEQGEG